MTDVPDETLWIDRRFPLALVLVSAAFIVVGLLLDGVERWSFVLSGAAFMAISVPVFWVKIAVLRADHIEINKQRIPYSQIVAIDGGSEFVSDLASRSSGRQQRQQDYVTVSLQGAKAPLKLRVTFYRDGPDGLATKIMARVAASR